MLTIKVDEAEVFDRLSILLVKSKKNPSIKNSQNYHSLANEIKEQIGLEKMQEVLNSQVFWNLWEANEKVFNGVDLAKMDLIASSELDARNYKRFLFKQELQRKFFNGELNEVKLGYS